MRYKDQKTTILSELFHILEKDQFAMYDLLDSIIESLTPCLLYTSPSPRDP